MRQEGDSAHRGACRLTGVRQCPRPPRGVMPRQTSGGREGYINTAKAGGSLPWEGQQALFCCVTCVSLQFVGQRRRQFAQGGCVRLCLRPESLYPGIGRSKRRRQVPVVLGFRPSPHHLKTGVAEVGFGREEEFFFFFFFFWCKGIRINTRIKNYAQHPLVWKESNLRLAPLPLDVPRAG